jgi:hypothetical protein
MRRLTSINSRVSSTSTYLSRAISFVLERNQDLVCELSEGGEAVCVRVPFRAIDRPVLDGALERRFESGFRTEQLNGRSYLSARLGACPYDGGTMSGPRDTFRKTRCLELVLWTVLPLVLAFPAFTSAQNTSEQQENLPAQPDTTCTREGGCSAVDFPNSITYDDSQTPPEAGATNRSMQSQPPSMPEQEQNRNQDFNQSHPNQGMSRASIRIETMERWLNIRTKTCRAPLCKPNRQRGKVNVPGKRSN